jgi:hypothetical protein
MPEIEDECIFEVSVVNALFVTQCNGDKLILSGLELTRQQAATLTWLINTKPETTKVEIKIKFVGQ